MSPPSAPTRAKTGCQASQSCVKADSQTTADHLLELQTSSRKMYVPRNEQQIALPAVGRSGSPAECGNAGPAHSHGNDIRARLKDAKSWPLIDQ